jgi:hypothetical protein
MLLTLRAAAHATTAGVSGVKPGHVWRQLPTLERHNTPVPALQQHQALSITLHDAAGDATAGVSGVKPGHVWRQLPTPQRHNTPVSALQQHHTMPAT